MCLLPFTNRIYIHLDCFYINKNDSYNTYYIILDLDTDNLLNEINTGNLLEKESNGYIFEPNSNFIIKNIKTDYYGLVVIQIFFFMFIKKWIIFFLLFFCILFLFIW